jgi:hypothetical protein
MDSLTHCAVVSHGSGQQQRIMDTGCACASCCAAGSWLLLTAVQATPGHLSLHTCCLASSPSRRHVEPWTQPKTLRTAGPAGGGQPAGRGAGQAPQHRGLPGGRGRFEGRRAAADQGWVRADTRSSYKAWWPMVASRVLAPGTLCSCQGDCRQQVCTWFEVLALLHGQATSRRLTLRWRRCGAW